MNIQIEKTEKIDIIEYMLFVIEFEYKIYQKYVIFHILTIILSYFSQYLNHILRNLIYSIIPYTNFQHILHYSINITLHFIFGMFETQLKKIISYHILKNSQKSLFSLF